MSTSTNTLGFTFECETQHVETYCDYTNYTPERGPAHSHEVSVTLYLILPCGERNNCRTTVMVSKTVEWVETAPGLSSATQAALTKGIDAITKEHLNPSACLRTFKSAISQNLI